MRLFRLIILSLLCLPALAHGLTLYTVGPDPANAPRQLTALTTAGAASSVGAPLADGSLGFDGGLAYRPVDGLLYGIANNFLGDSSLVSFTTGGGSLTTVASLGTGFYGGLAYDADDDLFYAIANDFGGNSTLYEVTPAGGATPLGLGPVGFGFRGLTWNSDDGLLYGVSGDTSGVPRQLNSITTTTATVAALFALGDGSLGFNGGLAYDADLDLFYVISNDFFGNSTLNTFTLAGASTLSPVGAFGAGFLNAGLTFGPEPPPPPAPIPEPSALLLVATGLGGLAWRQRARRGPSAHRRA